MNRRRPVLATAAATLTLGLVGTTPSLADSHVPPDWVRASTYTNPVSARFADTFADPAVIRGKDGWWYAVGTTDPLREGEGTRHLLPISRSADLVDWQYVGDAFTEDTIPEWADTENRAALWAPDIRYVDGQYRLYYVVTETGTNPERNDNAIGVATAPTPAGPWTDSGDPVVDPRRVAEDNFLWTFDPHHVMGDDGEQYLFFGSYYGGIWVTELDETGTEAVGEPTQVTIDNKYEGAYVVQRDGFWYLFASSANCCAGPTTGYSVHVGRSENLTGPYVDREGVPLLQSRAGGTPVIAPNGNAWVGTGHNSVVTDLAGQDWFVYHAIDRDDPYLDEPFAINERPMLIDRLDWVDGWPTVRAGQWASEGPQTGPVTGGRWVTHFRDGVPDVFRQRGDWDRAGHPQSGRHAVSDLDPGLNLLMTDGALPGDVRVEADFLLEEDEDGTRGAYGLVAGLRGVGDGTYGRSRAVQALVDPRTDTLILRTRHRGRTTGQVTIPLPAGHATTWHNLALEVRDGAATAELTEARLGDPLARLWLDLPTGTLTEGRAGARARTEGVHVDNLSVLPAAERVTEAVPGPRPGTVIPELSDEFDGTGLGAGWTRLRDPDVTVADGHLAWPVEAADLVGEVNDASVLLKDAPEGDWTAETKLTIDLGTDTVRNFQQGGLIAYVDDNHFARLSHVAIFNTRQTEFGKEMPFAGRLAFGGTIVGPPADTTWLRLTHRTDDAGEHELRASTSRDGRTWVHGGVWTLPAGADLKVGLISHGKDKADPGAAATSRFDYLRVTAD